MKRHRLWQILGRDLPIRVKFLVINIIVMVTTLVVSAILILRATSAVRENTLAAEKALISQSANTLAATADEVSTISETISSFPFLNQLIYSSYEEFAAREDIVFTISDDGVGMSPDKLKELNEALRKAELRIKSGQEEEPALSREPAIMSGTGIAITNTHLRLVLLYGHGYGLSFRSEEGKGTEVEVRIPKRTAAAVRRQDAGESFP